MAKIKQYILCLFLIICCCAFQSTAQTACKLVIQTADSSVETFNALQLTTSFNSKAACLAYVQKLPELLTTKGYISNSIDAVKEDSAHVYITLFAGKKYIWDNLLVEEKDWPVLNQLGYSSNSFNSKPFDQQKVTTVYNKLLDYFSNNGYPFAELSLDSMVINDNLISAKLTISKGSLYKVDTIIVRGDAKISKEYLTRYLGLEEHSMYQQEVLDRIDARLAELPFIVQSQPHSITMLNTGAEVNTTAVIGKANLTWGWVRRHIHSMAAAGNGMLPTIICT